MALRRVFSVALVTALIFSAANPEVAQGADGLVLWVDLNGFISPASAEHVSSAVVEASKPGYAAMILALDTFGGSMDSTFKIIESIQQSPVPVIGYVYPPGKQALSAGTIILMATDYAVMAPFTTIGSAQPILGTEPVEEPKIINALTKKVAELARLHERDEEQASRFITHNDNLGAEEALSRNVIEAVAKAPDELLAKAQGATVNTLRGPRTLATEDARIERLEPGVRTILLGVISDPLVSPLFMSIGFLALILGLTSPGWGAEVAGAILLLLGLVGLGFNVNLTAMALMAIGAVLLIFDIYTPGFGIAGLGGIITSALGITLLVTQPVTPTLVAPNYIGTFFTTLAVVLSISGGFFSLMVYKAAKAMRLRRFVQPYPSGEGRAVDELSPSMLGYVMVGGEYWQARATEAIKAGGRVRVVKAEGRVLVVEPAG